MTEPPPPHQNKILYLDDNYLSIIYLPLILFYIDNVTLGNAKNGTAMASMRQPMIKNPPHHIPIQCRL